MRTATKRRIVTLTILFVVSTALVVSVLTLMRHEDLLAIASRSSDTITMDIVYCDEGKTLTVHQTVHFTNRTEEAKNEVKFHIFANAYREGASFPPIAPHEMSKAFPNGRSFGHIDISAVSINASPAPFEIGGEDETVLIIPLPLPLQANQSVLLTMDYVVQLANIAHRLGWTERVVNLGNFYPIPVIKQNGEWMSSSYSYNGDPFFNQLHNFRVTFTKPRDFIMASSGMIMRESDTTTNGQKTRTTLTHSYAIRDWAAVLSPHFQISQRIYNRVAVSYFYLDDENPVRSLETSVRSLQTFSRLFVRYPYRQLTVVQTDFLHGGMEYGEIVWISTSITDRFEIDRVIIHEIAHQWWYGIIGNDQVRHAWIDEGLAEYSTLLFFDENPGWLDMPRLEYINAFRTNFATFLSVVHGIGGTVNMNMNRPLNEFQNQLEYVYLAYVRSMLLFADLESLIGRDTMVRGLRRLAIDYKFAIVTPDSLINVFEYASNMRLGLFFHAYTTGFVQGG